MASQWFCRVLGQEMGPLSFQDLTEMVRAGTLTENDPVRRKESSQWNAAREVIGLFRKAKSEAAETAPPDSKAPPKPAPVDREPAKPGRSSRKISRLGKRGLLWMGGRMALVLLVLLAAWGWRLRQSRRFPEPRMGKPRPAAETQLASLLPPRPEVPSIPGLKEQKPELVPGLEDVDAVSSLCLSADLRTIVFSAPAASRPEEDLYIAARPSVSEPFGNPKPVIGCLRFHNEDRPALSPDGSILVFLRHTPDSQLCYCFRDTESSEFGEPVHWPAPGLDSVQYRVGHPRFVGNDHLVLAVTRRDTEEVSFQVIEQVAPFADLGPAQVLPTTNLGWQAFLAGDWLRSYIGSDKGLFVSVRSARAAPFGSFHPILDVSITGPIIGPVWVSPQEDVVFYCSTGPGKELGSATRLWMVRF